MEEQKPEENKGNRNTEMSTQNSRPANKGWAGNWAVEVTAEEQQTSVDKVGPLLGKDAPGTHYSGLPPAIKPADYNPETPEFIEGVVSDITPSTYSPTIK